MISSSLFPSIPPQSAQDAAGSVNAVLAALGLCRSSAKVVEPASKAQGVSGAVLEVAFAESDLKTILLQTAEAKAREQGAKILGADLKMRSVGENQVGIQISLKAKAMMASVDLRVEGELFVAGEDGLGLRRLVLDAGAGMFAGVAGAMLRPLMAEWEGRVFALSDMAKHPLRVQRLWLEGASRSGDPLAAGTVGEDGCEPSLQVSVQAS